MRWRGRLGCFVVLLALAGPVTPAYAAERAGSGLGRVWTWLESWLPWVVAIGDQTRPSDPNGRQGAGSATSDQGFAIDPDG
jgi:hypothetical protein